MYNDNQTVVISSTIDISSVFTVKVGGKEIEPIELIRGRQYAVPYGAEVTITNSSNYYFNLLFGTTSYIIRQIDIDSSLTMIALRDFVIKEQAKS